MNDLNWHTEKRKVKDLIPWNKNPRKINAKQKQDLKDSLDRFNLMSIPVIDADNTIVSGHQRMKIMVDVGRGDEEIDVRVPNRKLTKEEYEEANLRENKNQGEFDLGLLTAFDPALLTLAGFDGDMVDAIFELEAAEDDYDADAAAAKIETPKTVEGDVYEFPGGHRLMCGDSENLSDVEKLMNGKKADLVYTDPPYNVNYKSSWRKTDTAFGKIKNDNMKDDDFQEWLTAVFKNIFIVTHEHVNIYCWFGMSTYPQFRSGIEAAGFRYMQVCFWLKNQFMLSAGWHYHCITEPVMIFYKDWKKKLVNIQYAKNSDFWTLDRLTFEESLEVWYQKRDEVKNYQHPTQKPVRLGERAMKRNSEPGQIVLDLFGGGGSTLLCAHQLQRVCYMMELDPKYVDVVVDRFTKMTGAEPKRLT